MARRVVQAFPRALLILDAQPLSLLADQDRRMTLLLKVAEAEGYAAAVSTVSIAEVRRTGQAARHLRWLRSRLTVIPATEIIADRAAELLEHTGLDGHDNVVDALVVATAACSEGPVKIASTDGSHVPKLCHAASLGRSSPVEWVRV
ncbi:type II toxin-antitoxin system VapC family toxin [Streptomyces sp. NPDC057638]|uniref:type II toxin-antitoxin system VapC family toxin n=1 Tax=Streptomyces sp. NPDC057638 TaxID=3346190 RepID=UPI003677545C